MFSIMTRPLSALLSGIRVRFILYSRAITFAARERVCLSAERELSVRSAVNVIGREYNSKQYEEV